MEWTAADWDDPAKYLLVLEAEHVEEVSRVADLIVELSTGRDEELSLPAVKQVTEETFSQTSLYKRLLDIRDQNVLVGQGFYVFRGLPVHDWSTKKSAAAFLAISQALGTLRPQNKRGHLLGHVTDLGLSSDDPNVRVYQTSERQTFHTDSADIVLLLCLQPALEGGISSVVSTQTIVSRIQRDRQELLPSLLKPLATDRRGEIPPGALPFYTIPVISQHDGGLLTGIYQRQYIDSAQRFEDAPRLTETDVEALNLFDTLCNDPTLQFNFTLQPGDIQILHNHTTLHDRSAFRDDPHRRRHLLRAWVAPPNARPLPEVFAQRFGSITPGDRGGINLVGVEPVAIWDVDVIRRMYASGKGQTDRSFTLAT